jgi:hypothetical protein
MNTVKKAVVATIVAIAGFSSSAQAALIGDTITLSGASVSSSSQTIGNNVEFSGIAQYLNFDFTATGLIVTVPSLPSVKYDFAANLGSFTFSGFDDVITGLTLQSNDPKFDNFVASNYSFGAHSITLDFSGIQAQNKNSTLVFNIALAPDASVPGASVPEPTSVALIGLGLFGVAVSRRKSGKSTKV